MRGWAAVNSVDRVARAVRGAHHVDRLALAGDLGDGVHRLHARRSWCRVASSRSTPAANTVTESLSCRTSSALVDGPSAK
ncbi:MAG: hypothetical protein R2719_01250 [Micropruina sp.]